MMKPSRSVFVGLVSLTLLVPLTWFLSAVPAVASCVQGSPGCPVLPFAPMHVQIAGTDSTTPLFSAVLSGSLGTPVDGEFFLTNSSGTAIGGSPTATGTVPNGEAFNYRVPDGVLTAGSTYKLTVLACYGTACYPSAPTRPTTYTFTLTSPTTTSPTTTTTTIDSSQIVSSTGIADGTGCSGGPCAVQHPPALSVGGDGTHHWVSAMKFPTTSIPAGADVVSATLNLSAGSCLNTCGTGTVGAYPADSDVSVASTGQDLFNDTDATLVSSVTEATGTRAFDITPLVSGWMSGMDNDGLVLQTSDEMSATHGLNLYSESTSNTPSQRPYVTVTYVPPATPSAPTSLSVTPGDTGVVVSWDTPQSAGISGSDEPISGYTVNILNSSGTVVSSTPVSSSNHAVVSGLTNGQSYTASVTATNSLGAGTAATAAFTPAAVTSGSTYIQAAEQYTDAQNKLEDGQASTASAALVGESQSAKFSTALNAEAPSDTAVYTQMTAESMNFSSDTLAYSAPLALNNTLGGVDVYLTVTQTETTVTGVGTSTPDSTDGEAIDDLLLRFSSTGVLSDVVHADPAVEPADPATSGVTATSATLDPPPSNAPSSIAMNADGTFNTTQTTRATSAGVSAANEVSWALAHWDGSNNGYGDDCTDFASRALHLGGGMKYHQYWIEYAKRTNDSYWYYHTYGPQPNDITYSWGGAYNHADFENREGGIYLSYVSEARPGDIMFANWGGGGFSGIHHTGVVTKESNGEPFITQHTSARKNYPLWGDKYSWYTVHPNVAVWVVIPNPSYY